MPSILKDLNVSIGSELLIVIVCYCVNSTCEFPSLLKGQLINYIKPIRLNFHFGCYLPSSKLMRWTPCRFKQSPVSFFFAPEIQNDQNDILTLAVWKFISAARLAIFWGWKPPESLGLRPWSVAAGPPQRFLHRSPPAARQNCWRFTRFTAVISHTVMAIYQL